MKKSALISLICSLVAVITVMVGVILVVSVSDGTTAEKKKLIISSASSTAIYNGEPLTDNKWFLKEGEIDEEHTLSVTVTGAQRTVGISENHISARVFDRNGTDITAEYYNIEYIPGVLNVKPRPITLIADSAMKEYDGEPLTCSTYQVERSASLLPTHTVIATVEGSITEKGTEKNVITSVTIINENEEEVTRNYEIQSRDGRLVIYMEDEIVIRTSAANMEYNGTALTSGNWEVENAGSLKADHYLDVTVTGSQTDAGYSDNTAEIIIRDRHGNDVTQLYDVSIFPGKLNVTQREVTVTAESAQKVYDGEPLRCQEHIVVPAFFENELKFQFSTNISGEQTEIGKSENTVTACAVLDTENRDITKNFIFTFENGELEVKSTESNKPIPLVITSKSVSKQYDGEPLVDINYSVEGDLLDGHYAKLYFTSSITEVGMVDNAFTAKILDSKHNDVTEMYDIKSDFGTLKVTRTPVKVVAGTAQKVYDGTPLTCNEFTVSPADLMDKFTFECEIVGSWTEVGKIPNQLSSVNIYYKGVNVSSNFEIDELENNNGWLIVVESEEEIKPTLHYTSGSASKIYDGSPLTCHTWERVSGELLENHRVVVDVYASLTLVDEVSNDFTLKVYDENDNDVTDMYIITTVPGLLTVTQKEITVTSASAMKEYDGTPLTNPEYTIKNTDENDTSDPEANAIITVEITGSITDPGEIENTISKITVEDADGNDISSCYKIERKYGTLVVRNKQAPEVAFPPNDMIDTPKTGATLLEVYSDINAYVYFKGASFGDYDVSTNTWKEAPVYGKTLSGKKSAYYLPVLSLEKSKAKTDSMTINPVGKAFVLPYYAQSGSFDVQSSDTVMSGDITAPYSVNYYGRYSESDLSLPSELAAFESEYADFVEANYSADGMDAETLEYMQGIITAKDFDISDPDIVNKVVRYIKNAAKYNLEYDKNLDKEPNKIVAFLDEYKEGVCRHYAGAATMLFRALGIPARYTVGFVGDLTAGAVTNITDEQLHAWVEIYVRGTGWIMLEVTGGSDGQDDPGEFFGSLTVTPEDTCEQYVEGGTVYASQNVTGADSLDRLGYRYEATVSGSQSEPGVSESEITGFKIWDENDQLVYDKETGLGADKFSVSFNKGKVQAYISALVLKSTDKTKTYDGKVLAATATDVLLESGTLNDGHRVVVEFKSSIVNVGSTDNVFDVKILDKNDNEVTDLYLIKLEYGMLSVTPKEITIRSESDRKIYDGTPLTNPNHNDLSEQLADGDVAEVEVTGSITEVGNASNTAVLKSIKNSFGDDVSFNYEVNIIFGVLTVYPEGEDLSIRFEIEAPTTEEVYLKVGSYGDFVPATNDWKSAPVFSDTLEGGKSAYYLPALALNYAGAKLWQMTVDPVGGVFALPYYSFSGEFDVQGDDTVLSGKVDAPYQVNYYSRYTTGAAALSGKAAELEREYASFVWENYRDVDTATRGYVQRIIDYEEFSADDPDIVNKVAQYIKSAATYKLDFNPAIDESENSVIEFFEKKEGICRHYANAAMVMLRMLDIPARYTVGYKTLAYAGEKTVVTSDDAHAWVEYYVTGFGWKMLEVTGGAQEETPNFITLNVTPVDTVEQYTEGTVLEAIQAVTGAEFLADMGYTYEVKVSGSQSVPGVSESNITGFTIFDQNGEMIYDLETGYGAESFGVIYNPGKVQLYISKLVFESVSNKKTYDGEGFKEYKTAVMTEGELATGHRVEYEFDDADDIYKVSKTDNKFTPTILDADDNDVTGLYLISCQYGTLEIVPRKITVTSATSSKIYDGAPLEKPTCIVVSTETGDTENALANGDELTAVIVGSITDAGSISNEIVSITIANASGEDVSEQYAITRINGKLTVSKRNISVLTASDGWMYDGEEHAKAEFEVAESTPLAPNQTARVSVDPVTGLAIYPTVKYVKHTEKGNNVFSVDIFDGNEVRVTENYEIAYVYGTLTITPKYITVTSESDEKVYDGEPLVNPGWSHHNTDPGDISNVLGTGDTIEVTVTGSITDPGSVENTISEIIINNADGSANENYVIARLPGQLTVKEDVIELVLIPKYTEGQYVDGEILNALQEIEGEGLEKLIEKGYTYKFVVSGSLDKPGKGKSEITSFIIYDVDGETEIYNMETGSEKFDVTYKKGAMYSYISELTYESATVSKVYDGYGFSESFQTVTLSAGALATGHREVPEFDENDVSFKVISVKNTFKLKILDENDQDVTELYKVTLVSGTVSITPKKITVVTQGAEKVYDGTPLTNGEYEVKNADPLDTSSVSAATDTMTVEVLGTITKAGSVNNTVKITVVHESGEDVTDCYEIVEPSYGKLKVTPKQITATTGYKSKIYDAKPLTYEKYEFSNVDPSDSSPLAVPGDTIQAKFTASITDPGSVLNTVVIVATNEAGEDVSNCYQLVDPEFGVLTVHPRKKGGAGFDGSISDGGETPIGEEVLKVTPGSSGTIYFKNKSFGDFDPATNKWGEAPKYDPLVMDNKSAYYLTSLAIGNVMSGRVSMTINSIGGIYVLPYYTYTPGQLHDAVMTGATDKAYTVSYYAWDNTEGVKLPSTHNAYASSYREFVYGNYMSVDTKTRAFLDTIIYEEGFSSSDPINVKINDVANYIKRSAGYNMGYNRLLDDEEEVVKAFLSDEYKEGVCRHFATAATLLYRALGVPARYTVGYRGNSLTAGKESTLTDYNAHAWVEVYVDTIGWVKVEVTGTSATAGSEKINLTLSPAGRTEIGDDSTVLIPNQEINGFSEKLERKYRYEFYVSGRQEGIGKSESVIEWIKIYQKSNDELVYDSDEPGKYPDFNVKLGKGTLRVYRGAISFKSESREKIYDGTPLVGGEGSVNKVSGTLPQGYWYKISYSTNASITNVGQTNNSFSVTIYDSSGKVVDEEFKITTTVGKLTVTAREITVNAGSATRVYDPSLPPLTCDDYWFDESELAEGDVLVSCVIEGSQSELGSSPNYVRGAVIMRGSENVTKNYTIIPINGTLTITNA